MKTIGPGRTKCRSCNVDTWHLVTTDNKTNRGVHWCTTCFSTWDTVIAITYKNIPPPKEIIHTMTESLMEYCGLLREVLGECEWISDTCPICGNYDTQNHDKDCLMNKALGRE